MPRVRKSREEIANQFFVNTSEIARLFGCGRRMAINCFNMAREADLKAIEDPCFGEHVVRLSTVLQILGISEKELRQKIASHPKND